MRSLNQNKAKDIPAALFMRNGDGPSPFRINNAAGGPFGCFTTA